MAVDIVEDFEGGTNGAVITTSNTGLGFTDGVATFTNTGGVHTGSLAALYSATAGTSYSVVYFGAPTLRGASYARFYVTFAALPAANVLIGAYRAVTTSRAELRINSAGTVTLRNGTTAVYTSTATLAANTTYRIEWDAVNGTGQAVRVYVGDSTTALISSGNQTYNTGTHDRLSIGLYASATWTLRVDDIETRDDANPGPMGGTAHTADGSHPRRVRCRHPPGDLDAGSCCHPRRVRCRHPPGDLDAGSRCHPRRARRRCVRWARGLRGCHRR